MATGMMASIQEGPKNWKELTPEDKIERMRSLLKSQERTIRSLQEEIAKYERLLVQHKHLPPDQSTVTLLHEEFEDKATAPPNPFPWNDWSNEPVPDGPSDDVFF